MYHELQQGGLGSHFPYSNIAYTEETCRMNTIECPIMLQCRWSKWSNVGLPLNLFPCKPYDLPKKKAPACAGAFRSMLVSIRGQSKPVQRPPRSPEDQLIQFHHLHWNRMDIHRPSKAQSRKSHRRCWRMDCSSQQSCLYNQRTHKNHLRGYSRHRSCRHQRRCNL